MLVGRHDEQQALDRLLAAARVGHSGVLVLTGDPGIGKTALLDHAVEQAGEMTVRRVSGTHRERDMAFAGLHQLLRPDLDRVAELPEPQSRAVSVALALSSAGHSSRFAVAAGVLTLVSTLAEERPLLVVVDDLHDLDRPSAEVISFVARRLVADRVALVLATRPQPQSPAAGLPVIEVTGIGREHARVLLQRAGEAVIDDTTLDRVHQATGGNPLALVELARDTKVLERLSPFATMPVPEALQREFARRLEDLPSRARQMLLLTAVAEGDLGDCGHVWRQDTSSVAEARSKLSRRGLRWALEGIVLAHLTVARVAEGLGVAWNTANDAVLAEGKRVLIDDTTRFDGVKVLGVDERVWRHTRRGDKYVTVIIDLTGIREGTGPARLLDMVEGRSKQVFKTWLAERPEAWRQGVEVVAMDGFSGFKSATAEELPDAVAVMDPFHVVRLAGDALDRCRRRVQQAVHGHRGHKGDPLYSARRTLHTGSGLLTDKQKDRLAALFAAEEHVEVEATWGIYQRMIAAYREPDRPKARELMSKLIESVTSGVPAALSEIITLGRTLKKRADDVLAYFDRPGTSNGPTEAICESSDGWSGTGWSGWFRSC